MRSVYGFYSSCLFNKSSAISRLSGDVSLGSRLGRLLRRCTRNCRKLSIVSSDEVLIRRKWAVLSKKSAQCRVPELNVT
jgi:hypothetical protein